MYIDIIKLLTKLKDMEWADGSDYTAIELEKLIEDIPSDEEQLAEKIFDIYFYDRSQTYTRAQENIRQAIIKCLEE